MGVSRWGTRRTDATSNEAFFRAHRRAPWPLVAVGMIAGSISGVTLISVPGWVAGIGMTYLQMCMGYILGYVAVAFLLLPLYYRLNLTSIYAYLGQRFGLTAHRTGALFFLLSKLTGAAARLYLTTLVLHTFRDKPDCSTPMCSKPSCSFLRWSVSRLLRSMPSGFLLPKRGASSLTAL